MVVAVVVLEEDGRVVLTSNQQMGVQMVHIQALQVL
jgi:hypothetical protein